MGAHSERFSRASHIVAVVSSWLQWHMARVVGSGGGKATVVCGSIDVLGENHKKRLFMQNFLFTDSHIAPKVF